MTQTSPTRRGRGRSAPAAGLQAREAGPAVRPPRFAAALAAAVLLILGGSAGVGVAGAAAAARATPRAPLAHACSTTFFDGDSRLGPDQLQAIGTVAPMLVGYDRLAGLSPQAFIARYWDPQASGGRGGWRYPPQNGYLIGANGQPIEHVISLYPGEELDRFGSEFGSFLAPEDTPYAERALPPQSLDVFDPAFTCNYHLYRVTKRFTAEEGPIAPGFGQIGHGLQIQLVAALVPGAPSPLNVRWLIDHGYLVRGT